jgi:hypothetical protein
VLAEYLTLTPGCVSSNAWCNAPENAYSNGTACGCGLVGGGSEGTTTAALALLAAAFSLAALRRRRALRAASLTLLGVATMLSATSARADANDAPTPPIPPRTSDEKAEAVKEHKHASAFALAANLGGSFVDPGAAQSLGVRYRASELIALGLDAELNEWYGVNSRRFELGATSVYATGIFRFPMRFEPINLRATLHLGGSYELLDLYGVPKGSVGLFAGAFPLGLEWKISERVFLIVNPLGIAVPVPHLTGAPFAYPQFRTELGVEIAL